MKMTKRLSESLRFSLGFVILLWIIHIFQFITTIDLGYLGIRPHATYGLRGILFAPLLHDNEGFTHLVSNSAPLLVLMTLIKLFYRRVALRSFLMIYVLTGLAVWIFARPVYHIGASGVVYGLVSFVFWSGIFRRNIKSVVLALIVTFLYSGFIWGVLPYQEGVSWESHLFGGLVGIFTAYWYKEEIEKDEEPRPLPAWATETADPLSQPYFLDRDTFNKTKEERRREAEEQARLRAERERDDKGGWFSNNTWE